MKYYFFLALLIMVLQIHAECAGIMGYIRSIPQESDIARAERHQRIAERRKGPIVLVHRGASAFAPENSLEAYTAAMDYGADGCEVDIRRTADGIFVMFHDDMLDNQTDGFGRAEQLTYYELLSLQRRRIYGTAGSDTRIPTLASLLTLARERNMLLFLDIKEKGLDQEVAKMLDEADMWDHIVAINLDTCQNILKDPRCQLLRFKAPGLYEKRLDMDPEAVKSALEQPGEMIILDDPRVAARELKRPAYKPESLPDGLREECQPKVASANPSDFVPMDYLRNLQKHVNPDSLNQLVAILESDMDERDKPDGSEVYERRRTGHIVARAWAAQRLGELGDKSGMVIKALEDQVKNRSVHPHWMYDGLDGAMASLSLGKLKSKDSAKCLIDVVKRSDTAKASAVSSENGAWSSFRLGLYVMSPLGDMGSDAGKAFLKEFIATGVEKDSKVPEWLLDFAAQGLLKYDLAKEELESLLKHPNSNVRGVTVLSCMDHPTRTRKEALKSAAPWALSLPGAKNRIKQ